MRKLERDFISKTSSGKFQVKSHSGKVLGTHPTRAAALKQLRAVEYSKAHDEMSARIGDDPARMGALELPGATEEMYLGRNPLDSFSPKESNVENQIQPHELPATLYNQNKGEPKITEGDRYLKVEEPAGGPAIDALDAFSPKESNVENVIQPHELPERRSNPHHAADPLQYGPDNTLAEGEHYLRAEEPAGGPAVDSEDDEEEEDAYDVSPETLKWREKQEPGSIMHPATFKAIKKAAKAAGAKDPEAVAGAAYWATVKAKHKKAKGEADEESLVPHEELKAPFEPGGNGDPSPNPSARQTIGSTKSVTIAGGANISQPEEYRTIDEGDPNQYEMLSTARKAPDLNEATEPDYFEYVPPSSGPDDRKQRWQDPAGDDDWLRSIGVIGAHPNMGGSKL